MVSLKSVFCVGTLVYSAIAANLSAAETETDCGKKNIVFTGLPPTHPLVAKTGYDPKEVGPRIQMDIMNIIAAGYNVKGVLLGPEQPIQRLADELEGMAWDGVGVGFGLRGPSDPELTVRFEDVIDLYKTKTPKARILFNYSPDTALWAIARRFPLKSNCTDSPGQLLGVKIFCDICK